MPHILTRRHVIGAAAALALPDLAFAQGDLAATPACHDGDAPTVRQTDGPFFKPSSPERADLRDSGPSGRPLDVTGVVGEQMPVLTTQLYFPDEPLNRSDGLFRRELVMRLNQADDRLLGRFDFVLDLG